MFGRNSSVRMLASDVADMERRMRMLERDVRHFAGRASASAAQATEQVGDAVASALADVFGRFRGSAGRVGDEAARFGSEAVRIGNTAARKLADEVEHRPLTMLAVVAGLGLLIGLAGRRN
jgi:ElaB/YqjD/DUF883 family membrane-anchored ribosome-binding protein